ncbi:MAG TPA: TetR family transcriptional regulator [Gemmatimonadaceae bacterium]|jgi:TetR/AcrR family transcriptional repressor of bet genes|nr:TetR family transcriptional regulator [Gemmatimonadaceae bacterium]
MVGRKVPEATRREEMLRAAYDVAARQGLEALTLRSVAARADVSHGTVVFHFKRKHELVAALLDRTLYATAVMRVPDAVAQITRPSERLHALLRSEMDRLSTDPRHFRLFLEYWTIGVRNAAIRRKIRLALESYRAALASLASPLVTDELSVSRGRRATEEPAVTAEGVASVAVSLIHGCALQAVIDPKGFDVRQHFIAAAKMIEQFSAVRR